MLEEEDAPATAAGGITRGSQIRRVGEAGREAIIPLAKLPEMMARIRMAEGRNGGGGNSITIMGDMYGWDDMVDTVGRANVELEERGG